MLSSHSNSSAPSAQSKHIISISKRLAWLLRHSAPNEGFQFHDGGYLFVDELLRHRSFNSVTLEDIEQVVQEDRKQRYELRRAECGRLQIRAAQGHSVQVGDLKLQPLTEADCQRLQRIVHGTFRRNWRSISAGGLSRMARNHIHFVADDAAVATGEISGLRQNANLFIFVDLVQAHAEGIKFSKSSNGVILTEGDANGCVPPKFFTEVWQKRPERLIFKDGQPFD